MGQEVEVWCPLCGRPRWVSPERASRIDRAVVSARCRSCKELPDAALPRPQDAHEDNLRWWCIQYGVSIPRVAVPSLYLKMHGVPEGLGELVASLRAAV